MFKTKNKKILIIAAVLAGTILYACSASAAYNPVSRNTCTLMIKPFSETIGATYGTAGDQFINYLSESICHSHVTYGNSYQPQPPVRDDNPLRSGAENRNLPITRHDHTYINDSVQDGTLATGYYYKAFVDKFEIVIESDGYNNIRQNEIYCDTPGPPPDPNETAQERTERERQEAAWEAKINDCNGTAHGLWGGTRVTKQVNNNNKTITITWDFGYDANYDNNPSGQYVGRPYIWGNNGSSFQVKDSNGQTVTLNLTTDQSRDLPFSIHMTTKNNDSIWSTTTTSRVLLADLAIRKSNYANNQHKVCVNNDVNDPNSGWCYLTPVSGYTRESVKTQNSPLINRTYYWFPIGSVVTIWKKPTEEQPPVCEEVTLDPPYVLAPGTTNYTAKVRFSDGNSYQTTLNWGGNGTFSQGVNQTESDNIFNNNFTTTNETSAVIARVTDIVGAENSVACKRGVTVNQGGPFCTNLVLTPSSLNNYPANTPLQARAVFSDGNAYQTTVQWTGTGAYSADTSQTSASAQFSNTFTPANITATAGVRVTDIVGAANSAACRDGLTITQTGEEPYCTDLILTPDFLNDYPADTPLKARAVFSDGNAYTTTVGWTGEGNFSAGNTQTSANASFNNTFTPASDTATAAVRVTNVIGARNSSACEDGLEITPETTDFLCEDLNLSPNIESIEPGETILLSANPVNTNGDHVPRVIWSESGEGFFFPGRNSVFNPVFCGISQYAHSADISFTRLSFCDYFYTAPNNENASIKIEASPNIGNVPDCIAEIPVKEKEYDDRCIELNLRPRYIRRDSLTTDFTASLVFEDAPSYEVTLGWSGVNEGFDFPSTRGDSSGLENTFTRRIAPGAVSSGRVWLERVHSSLNIDLGDCAQGVDIQLPPEECTFLEFVPSPFGQICIDTDYNGDFIEWTIGNETYSIPNLPEAYCQPVEPLTSVHALAVPEICEDSMTTEAPPPDLNKLVRRLFPSVGPFRTVTTTPAEMPNDEPILVEYRVEFIPYSMTTATIVDPIANGIQGESYPSYYPEGTLVYANDMRVMENDSRPLQECTEGGDTNCYSGSIGSTSGITLYGVDSPIVIYYLGEVTNTSITPEHCTDADNPSCYEFYRNRARITQYDTEYSSGRNIFSNWAEVQLFCQYILTRAAGDIFLERELDYGVDISWCAEVPNVPGVPVTPGTPPPPGTPSTGITEQITTISHEICAQGQAGTLDPGLGAFYGKDIIGNISSQICEIKLQTGESWKQSVITNSIDENKTRISRWGADLTGSQFIGAVTSKLETQDVVHIKGDLTVNFPLKWADGQGAKTIIIENGDLIINKDIKYGPCPGICNINEIASLAFIVLNGNIYVDPDINELAGVYFVQEGSTSGTGHLYSGSPLNNAVKSYIPLKIYGSVYGDIEPLFRDRVFAGDPLLEEAGIMIRFDERVILNTPPGLTDILDLSLFKVAR